MTVGSFSCFGTISAKKNVNQFYLIPETFKQFLDENFDDRSYANNIIQGRAISDSLARLADGINLLDKELHSQVCCFVSIKSLEWLFCLGYR